MLKRIGPTGTTLVLVFLLLLAVPLLYLFRGLDGNTLVSWRWVFAPSGIARLYPWFLLATFAAALAARTEIPSRLRLPVLAGVGLLFAASLRNLPEVLLDASRHFLQAGVAAGTGPVGFLAIWGRDVPVWTDLPVPPLLYGIVLDVIGPERSNAQALNLLLFLAALLLVHGLGRQLWDDETGFHGALLMLAVPFLLTQVPLFLVDIHALFFLTLTFYLFSLAARSGRTGAHVAAGLAGGLALLTKYSLWPMLLFVPAVYTGSRRAGGVRWEQFLYALLATMIVIGPFLLKNGGVVMEQIDLLRQFQIPGLGRWTEGWISVFLFQIHPFVTFGALGAGVSLLRNRDPKWRLAAGLLLFVVVFRATRIRYLLPLLPLLTLLAARGLMLIPFPFARRYAVFGAVFVSGVVLLGGFQPFLMQTSAMNLSRAGEAIDVLPDKAVRVVALPQTSSEGRTEMAIPLLRLSTRKRLFQAEPWGPSMRPEKVSRSPLRFTWEMPKPGFLDPKDGEGDRDTSPGTPTLVLSADRPDIDSVRKRYRLPPEAEIRTFDRKTDVFRYRTLATLFIPNGKKVTGDGRRGG